MVSEHVKQIVYLSLREYITREGCPPTYRETATDTGYSIETVHKAVKALVDDGLLTMEARKWRSVKLVDTEKLWMPFRVLFFIQQYVAEHHKAPLHREIANELRISITSVERSVRILKINKRVDVDFHKYRGVRVIKPLGTVTK